jgi:phosphoribosylglycinamide formyltransferase 1
MQEHIIYPLAVNWFCQGRLRCEAGIARLDGRPLNEPVQISEASPEKGS